MPISCCTPTTNCLFIARLLLTYENIKCRTRKNRVHAHISRHKVGGTCKGVGPYMIVCLVSSLTRARVYVLRRVYFVSRYSVSYVVTGAVIIKQLSAGPNRMSRSRNGAIWRCIVTHARASGQGRQRSAKQPDGKPPQASTVPHALTLTLGKRRRMSSTSMYGKRCSLTTVDYV